MTVAESKDITTKCVECSRKIFIPEWSQRIHGTIKIPRCPDCERLRNEIGVPDTIRVLETRGDVKRFPDAPYWRITEDGYRRINERNAARLQGGTCT